MKRLYPLLFVLLLLPVLACELSGNVAIRSDADWNYLTVTLTEQQIRDLVVPILENGQQFRVQSPVVDLRPGAIAVSGSVIGQNGQLYPGSMSIRAWAANQRLNLEVADFNFAGFTADAAQLQRFNADLAAGLARNDQNSNSETHEVAITDSAFTITWRSPR